MDTVLLKNIRFINTPFFKFIVRIWARSYDDAFLTLVLVKYGMMEEEFQCSKGCHSMVGNQPA